MELDIRPLESGNLGEFLAFFESVDFRDHPDWSACYCYSYHFTGTAEQWEKENNRRTVRELVRERKMKGYMAYHKGKPVGWCNANNRLNYQRLTKLYDLEDIEHPKTCAIVCFLIHHEYRRRGITRQLLQHIIDDYTALGYDYIEAYPRKSAESAEEHYKGYLELYLENGFRVVKESGEHFHVRKFLSGQ